MMKLKDNLYFRLAQILSKKQKTSLLFLQILVILMALVETIALVSITPFIASLLGKPIDDTNIFLSFRIIVNAVILYGDVLIYGLIFLILSIISNLLSSFTIWHLSIAAATLGNDLSTKLLVSYSSAKLADFNEAGEAQQEKNLIIETARFVDLVIQPMFQMNARIVLVSFICAAMMFHSFFATLLLVIVFLGLYISIYHMLKRHTSSLGRKITDTQRERLTLIKSILGERDYLRLLGSKDYYLNKYYGVGYEHAYSKGSLMAISQIPRYAIETTLYIIFFSTVVFISLNYEQDFLNFAPNLAFFALAGFKMLPALQIIYSARTQINGNKTSLDEIETDLKVSNNLNTNFQHRISTSDYAVSECEVRNISLTTDSGINILNDVSFVLKKNRIAALTGPSGSGKSTLINIVIDNIGPSDGVILLDGASANVAGKVAYLQQKPILVPGTIYENILFGNPESSGLGEQMDSLIEKLGLSHLVQNKTTSMEINLGPGGYVPSGGEAQRICIARTIISNREVILLDEPTSSLDAENEERFIDLLHEIKKDRCILIVSHSKNLLAKCDVSYRLNKGILTEYGHD